MVRDRDQKQISRDCALATGEWISTSLGGVAAIVHCGMLAGLLVEWGVMGRLVDLLASILSFSALSAIGWLASAQLRDICFWSLTRTLTSTLVVTLEAHNGILIFQILIKLASKWSIWWRLLNMTDCFTQFIKKRDILWQSFWAALVLRNPNFHDKIMNFNYSVKNLSQKTTITRNSVNKFKKNES